MKFILLIIAIILVLGVASFLLPAIIGICIGIGMIKAGSIIGGLAAIFVGIAFNIAMLYGTFGESGSGGGGYGYKDDECPACGSRDTDGYHCYSCDEDF